MIRSLDPISKQERKNLDWDSRILESLYDSGKKLQKINFSSPKKLIRTKYSIFKVYNQREENNSFFHEKMKKIWKPIELRSSNWNGSFFHYKRLKNQKDKTSNQYKFFSWWIEILRLSLIFSHFIHENHIYVLQEGSELLVFINSVSNQGIW